MFPDHTLAVIEENARIKTLQSRIRKHSTVYSTKSKKVKKVSKLFHPPIFFRSDGSKQTCACVLMLVNTLYEYM
jgi:hypothetical protein